MAHSRYGSYERYKQNARQPAEKIAAQPAFFAEKELLCAPRRSVRGAFATQVRAERADRKISLSAQLAQNEFEGR